MKQITKSIGKGLCAIVLGLGLNGCKIEDGTIVRSREPVEIVNDYLVFTGNPLKFKSGKYDFTLNGQVDNVCYHNHYTFNGNGPNKIKFIDRRSDCTEPVGEINERDEFTVDGKKMQGDELYRIPGFASNVRQWYKDAATQATKAIQERKQLVQTALK